MCDVRWRQEATSRNYILRDSSDHLRRQLASQQHRLSQAKKSHVKTKRQQRQQPAAARKTRLANSLGPSPRSLLDPDPGLGTIAGVWSFPILLPERFTIRLFLLDNLMDRKRADMSADSDRFHCRTALRPRVVAGIVDTGVLRPCCGTHVAEPLYRVLPSVSVAGYSHGLLCWPCLHAGSQHGERELCEAQGHCRGTRCNWNERG
jgi:hypothetical protein